MKSRTLGAFRIWALLSLCLVTALPAAAGDLAVGSAAPNFTLYDQSGKKHTLSDYLGQIVVLEWTNQTCPFVQRHYKAKTMQTLATKYAEDVVWLAIDSSHFTTPEACASWAEKYELSYPTLLDAPGEVGRMYGAKTTPHMFVIGKDGKVLYNGAIDDDPRGKVEEPINYVDAALASVLKGEEVAQATTKPYGCSVKYAGKQDKPKASASR